MISIQNDDGDGMIFANGFEDALVGYVTKFNQVLACYDYEECVKILIKRDGMTREEAVDYIEFNVTGAWVGDSTPCFLHKCSIGELMEKAGDLANESES